MGSPTIPVIHNGREEAAAMNPRLLIVALSVLSSIAGCNNTPEKVLSSLVIADTGHDLDGKTATEDEPSIPPKAAEPSVYVPPPEPPKEACTENGFRLYWCIDGYRQYI